MAEDEKRDLSDWDPSGETRCPVCKEKFLQHKLIAPHVIEKHPEEVNTAYVASMDLVNELKLALEKEREKSIEILQNRYSKKVTKQKIDFYKYSGINVYFTAFHGFHHKIFALEILLGQQFFHIFTKNEGCIFK